MRNLKEIHTDVLAQSNKADTIFLTQEDTNLLLSLPASQRPWFDVESNLKLSTVGFVGSAYGLPIKLRV